MKLPPDKVPDGLSHEEYMHHFRLYSLMGRQEAAFECMTRASRVLPAATGALAEAIESGSSSASADLAKPMDANASMKLGVTLLEVIARLTARLADGEGEPSLDDLVADLRSELLEAGLPAESVEELVTKIVDSSKSMAAQVPPPRQVPEGLTAEQYYELGKQYKTAGWTENAREALTNAMTLDQDGEVGRRSLSYLRSKIPRHPVPMYAEQGNVEGFNLLFSGDIDGARAKFEELIANYPDFEWPYGNLGSLLLQLGDLKGARKVLERALSINAFYVNAWLHYARLCAVEGKYTDCYDAISRAEMIDPEDGGAASLRDLVRELESAAGS